MRYLLLFGVLTLFSCLLLERDLEASVLGNAKILQCASNDRRTCRIIVSDTFVQKTPRPTIGVSLFQNKTPVFRISEILGVQERKTSDSKTYFVVDVVGKWAVSEKDQARIMGRRPLLRFLKIQKPAMKVKWAKSDPKQFARPTS